MIQKRSGLESLTRDRNDRGAREKAGGASEDDNGRQGRGGQPQTTVAREGKSLERARPNDLQRAEGGENKMWPGFSDKKNTSDRCHSPQRRGRQERARGTAVGTKNFLHRG